MQRETAQIWTPSSYRNREEIQARKAAQEYDPNLDFGFNEKTKQYCVYLKAGTMDASKHGDLPILGFTPLGRIPNPDEIKKRLYQSDAVKRGHEIIDEWNRQNDLLRNQDHSDVDREVAEHMEWGFRKMGSDKAPQKIYMGGK